MNPRICTPARLLALAVVALPAIAQASMNLALDKGCLNCHGTPPRGPSPTIAQLAAHYTGAQGNETDIARIATRLRDHHLFGGVPAHERLSAEDAERLVRWLVDGAR